MLNEENNDEGWGDVITCQEREETLKEEEWRKKKKEEELERLEVEDHKTWLQKIFKKNNKK